MADGPQLPGLTKGETDLLRKLMSSPMDLPQEFKSWLVKWLEVNPPKLAVADMLGATSLAIPVAKLSIAGTTALPNAAQTALQLKAAYDFRVGNVFADRGGVASGFSVTLGGYYLALGQLTYVANATGSRLTSLWKNGAAIVAADGGAIEDTRAPSATLATEVLLAGLVNLAANDFVQLVGFQNIGASMTPILGWVTLIKIA